MIGIAHAFAALCYLGAAALAAAPFARPVRAPVRVVIGALALGVVAHAAALAWIAVHFGQAPLTGLGPALSFAALVLAGSLVLVELAAREASLALVAAPLAAVPTLLAAAIGLRPVGEPPGVRGAWLVAHIALSFVGIGAFATAAAAGALYLFERRELKERRFGAVFRLFPPLRTLDRVNHVAAVAGWLGLTLGVVLAVGYSLVYRELNVPQIVWGMAAWLGVSAVALGRIVGGWQPRRAAWTSSVAFVAVVVLYVAFRVAASEAGKFL